MTVFFRIAALTVLLTQVGVPCRVWAETWSGKVIGEIQSVDMDPEDLAALTAVLGLSVGKVLDEAKLEAVLKQQGDGSKWVRVFVEGEVEKNRLHLRLRGTKVRRLRKLEYHGIDDDVLEEVRRRVRQDQDQNADIESFSSLRQSLKEAYQDRGYNFPEIQFATKALNADEADVEVRVTSGPPTLVGKIVVRGGPDEENQAMGELVPLQRGDIFSRIKLAEGVEKINAYLRANQYPTSRVADSFFQFSPDSKEVAITVQVKMGERFQILFQGNELFDSVQLKALLTDDVLAQTDPSLRIAQLVEAKYHAVGYPDARVEVKKTLVENGKLNLIEMRIHEGERAFIGELRFASGNSVNGVDLVDLFYEVAPGVLQRHLYWAEGISEAVAAMQLRLRSMGYLNSRITDPKPTFSEDRKYVVLFFDSDLGVQTLLNKVEFVGVRNFTYSDLEPEFAFEVGKPLNQDQVTETGKKLLAFYSASGFPQAKFTKPAESSVEISRDQQSATVRYEMDEGPVFRIGAINIEGLRKTKAKVILQEMDFQTGSRYDARKIRLAEENISLLGLFSRAEIVETPSAEPGVMDLRIVVRETRPGVGEVGFGGVYEDPRLRLRPFIGVTYRNVSGLNQTASVRADMSLPISRVNADLQIPFIEYSSVFGYRYPYALSLPVTFSTQVAFDRVEVRPAEQTILTRARVEGRLEKKFSSRVTAIYRLIRVERTRTESYKPVDAASAIPLTESIGSTGPGIIVDLRDDVFNPRTGSFHSLDVELAHPLLFSQATIGFILASMRNSFYVPVGPLGLALYLGLGYSHSLISGQPIARARLVNELSLGGQGSIRGIAPRTLTAPDPLTTRNMLYYNARAELSAKLFSDFGVAIFFDSGQIFPDWSPLTRADGVGVGLRYKTPVGPVVIDFAQGLGSFSQNVRFYFTVGTI